MGSKQSRSDSNVDVDGKQLAAKIMKESHLIENCDKPIDVKIRCPHCKSWRTYTPFGFDHNKRTCMYCSNQFTITDCERAIPAPQLKDYFE